jgi:hypothetical protein
MLSRLSNSAHGTGRTSIYLGNPGWMLPLGLVLLALDVALLRRPTARMLVIGERL